MHISPDSRRDLNILAAWAVAVADTVRASAEESTGLTGGGPAALVAIVADPGMSIDDLRRALSLTHPGAVRLVDRLVERGWIRREHGIGRTLRLMPTAEGFEAERALVSAREAGVEAMHAALDEEQVRALATLAAPALAQTTGDIDDLRRLCRLCDRDVCLPCPVDEAMPAH